MFELFHKWKGHLVEANTEIFSLGFLFGHKAWQVCPEKGDEEAVDVR